MRIKREAEEAAKARQDAAKREKENAKRALKRERKQLQNYGKQFNYFSSSEAEHVARMADLDRLCELLTIDEYEIRPGGGENLFFNCSFFLPNRLEKLNKKMEQSVDSVDKCRPLFEEAVAQVNRRIDQEKQQTLQSATGSSSSAATAAAAGKKKGAGNWSPEELNLLIKAVNLFPAGTNQRWEVVANFINQHHGGNRSAKDVLAQAKELQQSDFSRSALKEAANKAAYNKFEKEQKGTANEESVPSERYESIRLKN